MQTHAVQGKEIDRSRPRARGDQQTTTKAHTHICMQRSSHKDVSAAAPAPCRARDIWRRTTRSISHREPPVSAGDQTANGRAPRAQAPAAARRARPAPTHHHACMAPSRHYHASSRPAGGRPDVVAARARASGAPQAAAGRSCPAVPAGPDVLRRRCPTARGRASARHGTGTGSTARVAVARVPAVYPIGTRVAVALAAGWHAMATCRSRPAASLSPGSILSAQQPKGTYS